MDIGAAQFLGGHRFAGRGLHQRRTGEEDRALILDDDGLVRHRRHVGAARGARAHHHRDLGDARGRHVGLVVEDAAEMVAVREHLVLARQVRAAGIHQVDARQPVLERNLLRAQVLLHREREIGAALHRGVVGDHHAAPAADVADPGDEAGGGHRLAVRLPRRERRELEERRAGVEQRGDALARQQLAAALVLLARGCVPARASLCQPRVQLLHLDERGLRRGLEFCARGFQLGLECRHEGLSTRASVPPRRRKASPGRNTRTGFSPARRSQ